MSGKIIIEESKETQTAEYVMAERKYCEKEIDEYSKARKALQDKRQEFYNIWMKKGEH